MFNLLSLFEFMVTLAKYTSTTNMAFTFIFTLHSFSKCDHLRCLVVLEMNLAQLWSRGKISILVKYLMRPILYKRQSTPRILKASSGRSWTVQLFVLMFTIAHAFTCHMYKKIILLIIYESYPHTFYSVGFELLCREGSVPSVRPIFLSLSTGLSVEWTGN